MHALITRFGGFAAVLAVLVLAATAVKAEAPRKPVEFGGKVLTTQSCTQVALLMWVQNREGDAPIQFNVYQADGQTENMADFTKIAEVEVKPNTLEYKYEVTGLEPGVYTFFVRAANADGESDRSNIKVLVIKEIATSLKFVTEPNKKGTVNKPYRYESKAKATCGEVSELTYELVQGPDGMVIGVNGVIEWTPTEKGRYVVVIRATGTINGETYTTVQEYAIEVGEGDNNGDDKEKACATIFGYVKSDDPNATFPIMKGVVVAWRIDIKTDDQGNPVTKLIAVRKAEIKQGTYVIEVPAGTYKLLAEGPGFTREWWENAENADDATEVVVECNTRSERNFKVAAKPEPKKFVIEGTVTDENTGDPLWAEVVFESRKNSDDKGERQRYSTKTRDDGSFRIELPEGVAFIAWAKSLARDNKYQVEWFDNVPNETDATEIILTENRGDVNFTLAARPVYDNGISGIVRDSIGNGVNSWVTAWALRDNGTKGPEILSVTVETAPTGEFQILDLVPGTYILFVKPRVDGYVPGYFVVAQYATRQWKDATGVEVEEAGINDGITILLAYKHGNNGKGRGHGHVSKHGGIAVRGGDRTQTVNAISGVVVYAIDHSGAVVDWAVTGNDGAYAIENLGIGQFTFTAERPYYTADERTATVDAGANSSVNVNLAIGSTVTSVDVPTVGEGSAYTLFPNPAADAVRINFPAIEGTAVIRFVSATGEVVRTQTSDVASGIASVQLDATGLAAGSYLIHVTNGTASFALPMNVVR
jgi:hypothetical protein